MTDQQIQELLAIELMRYDAFLTVLSNYLVNAGICTHEGLRAQVVNHVTERGAGLAQSLRDDLAALQEVIREPDGFPRLIESMREQQAEWAWPKSEHDPSEGSSL
jgi:hypothetical protein